MLKNNKKKFIVSIIGIILLLLMTIGVTYAFFNYTKEGSTENTLTSGTITFLYTEVSGVGKGISINDAYPISDEQGKAQTGEGKVFDFKITSDTFDKTSIPYEITVRKEKVSTLEESAVKLYLTKGETEEEVLLDNYSNLTQTTKVSETDYVEKTIYTGSVPSNTKDYEETFRLRMWIDDSIDFSPVKDEEGNETYPYNGKTFAITVNVYANAKTVTEEDVVLENSTNISSLVADGTTLTAVEDETLGYDYEMTLPNGTTTTSITVETENPNATVSIKKIDNLAYNSTQSLATTKEVDLTTGDNYFKVTVTSANKENTKSYIIKITVEKNSINTIENLEVTGYNLSPDFDKETTEYTVTVEASSIEILATTSYEAAIVTGTGTKTLNWGENEFSINVTAEDGSIKTYKIIVTNQRPTAPVITGGNSSWVSTAPTIKVSTAGTALSGVDYYEYYYTTPPVIEPSDSSSVSTTTKDSVTINDEGTTYIWYRTVSNNGLKSEWSDPQIVNLDLTDPQITGLKRDGAYLKFTVSDNIGVVAYGVNTSETTEPTYTTIDSTTSKSISKSIGYANATYYVWIKDSSGRTVKTSIVVAVPFGERIIGTNTLVTKTPNLSAASSTCTTSSSSNSGSSSLSCTASDTSGLYKSTATNSGNPTYYFRGNVTNNYVKFAGLTWRIVRVNEDGTIRLILQDSTLSQYLSYRYTTSGITSMYYSSSSSAGAESTLSTWYSSNLANYKDKIATGDYFCQQAKVKASTSYYGESASMTVYSSYTPNFKCSTDGNGKGIVNSNIGLITYDEVIYAGGYYQQANTNFYLYNGNDFWTMSPAGSSSSTTMDGYAWYVNTYINNGSASGTKYLRPVINLKADVTVTGSGTSSSPYIVQ